MGIKSHPRDQDKLRGSLSRAAKTEESLIIRFFFFIAGVWIGGHPPLNLHLRQSKLTREYL